MTRRRATFLKITQLTIAHVLMIIVLIIGYDQAYNFIQGLISYAGSSSLEMYASAKNFFIQVISLDKPMLFGSLFIAGLIAYDIVSIGKWFNSFSFSRTRYCKCCERKLVREPRQPIDRFISYIAALKRYRCIACNKEYLIFDGKAKRKFTTTHDESLQPSPVKKSD